MTALHEVAVVACLLAGVAAVLVAPNGATRAAHAVMLVAMVVMAAAMENAPLVLLAGSGLLAAAVVLRRVSSKAADRLCALDLSVCGGLLLLSAVAVIRRGIGDDTASHMHGMPMPMPMPAPAPSVPLLLAVGVVLTVWLLLQRRGAHAPVRGPRALPGAAMVLAMATMVAA